MFLRIIPTLKAVGFAVSFVANNDAVDYFLIGVDSKKQLQDILDLEPYEQKDMDILDKLTMNVNEQWCDPRTWN
jgi:predicted aldo/keto reductase-like oxidoreductase